jgi:hypothetical protein
MRRSDLLRTGMCEVQVRNTNTDDLMMTAILLKVWLKRDAPLKTAEGDVHTTLHELVHV